MIVSAGFTPLVVEYYRTGITDRQRMRSVDAVQGQCRGCSVRRGGYLSGAPPELTDGEGTRKEMSSALFLVIDNNPDGVFLYRFDAKGQCVGDTWHMSIDDAKHQATYEYEGLVMNWQDVPDAIEDVAEYGRARARAMQVISTSRGCAADEASGADQGPPYKKSCCPRANPLLFCWERHSRNLHLSGRQGSLRLCRLHQ